MVIKQGNSHLVASILSLKNKAKSFVEDGEGGRENQRFDKSGEEISLVAFAGSPPFTLLLTVISLGNCLSPFLAYGLEIELTPLSPSLSSPITPTPLT